MSLGDEAASGFRGEIAEQDVLAVPRGSGGSTAAFLMGGRRAQTCDPDGHGIARQLACGRGKCRGDCTGPLEAQGVGVGAGGCCA